MKNRLEFTVKTNRTSASMKTFITDELEKRTSLKGLITEHRWDNTTLHAKGPLGSGTVTLHDYKADVVLELTLMGSAAKHTIESKLTKLLGE
ncbi:MAG: polyhydroxyalkanoic acid system family protein [Bradyrhizobiaceae bacterium]|nr:polyhydroxyalkanoic acid system family protein [Bradyrhizobiaceae bacterium]